MKKSSGVIMKLSHFTKTVVFIQLLLGLFILFAPTRTDINTASGLVGSVIILNRIRDYAAIPLSFGMVTLLIGSLYFTGFKKWIIQPPKNVRIFLFCCFLLMATVGAYWTLGFIRMEVYTPMSVRMGYYLMEHRQWIDLWWVLTGIFLLSSLYKPFLVD